MAKQRSAEGVEIESGLTVAHGPRGRGVFATRCFAKGEVIEACATVEVADADVTGRLNDYVFALAEVQVDSGGKNLAVGATVTSKDSIESGRWSKKYLVDNYDSRKSSTAGFSPVAHYTLPWDGVVLIPVANHLLGIQVGDLCRRVP